ncbi:MAG: hypothetical protein MUF84_18710 [Anaerolineae bacterium]|nr:hypothetical protein [Anaerolineae bacterium]
MQFSIPHAMVLEHDGLHESLTEVIKIGGKTGAAGEGVAEALHAHFVAEEEFALPPLGLLAALVAGKVSPDMAEVLAMTDMLEAEMPRMLSEHGVIVAALERLVDAATQEDRPEAIDFAEKLKLHAQFEEEVSYPTAILIGKYLRLKLGG